VSRFCFALFGILLLASEVRAETATPLLAHFKLTHIAPDEWRADYVFAKPVISIDLGPGIGEYRKRSWHLLTPGTKLTALPDREVISAGGKPFSRLSFGVSLYLPLSEGTYTAFDRMSDGGTDVFLGFFAGDATVDGLVRPLHLRVKVKGLAHETVIAPDDHDINRLSYAYFGPAKPVPAGVANLIVDPKTPGWMQQLLQETTAGITEYYDRAFQRRLPFRPLIMVSISDFERPGLSMKGGAVGKQVVYRLGGKALLRDSPQARNLFKGLIAHELAHVWQNDVSRGGIGGDEPWVHEGGAEAIAVAGLRGSGLYDQAEADAYVARLTGECAALNGSVETYRGYYACGFTRFSSYKMDVFTLWKAMMEATESSGSVYSAAMIESILKKADKTAQPTG